MRLWHQKIIPFLPRQQLLGQHREVCALRGKGWGRKHATVDYVFTHSPNRLVAYHYLVMNEMKKRGYHPDDSWYNPNWRGSILGEQKGWTSDLLLPDFLSEEVMIYPEHDNKYLQECLNNLKTKGVEINGLL